MSELPLTEEQLAVVNLGGLEPGRLVMVEARAGTGKTSTLRALAEANPRLRIRYVAFNRQAKESAEKTFPANVKVKTFDAVVLELLGADRCVERSAKEVVEDFAAWCMPVPTDADPTRTSKPSKEEASRAYQHLRRFSTTWKTRFVSESEAKREEEEKEGENKKKSKKRPRPSPSLPSSSSSSGGGGEGSGGGEGKAERAGEDGADGADDADDYDEEPPFVVPAMKSWDGHAVVSSSERMAEICQLMWEMIMEGRLACGGFDVAEKVVAFKRLRVPNCDLMLVDEAQDLNAPMVICAMRHLEHCCVCFVGDPMQHIYQFKGTASVFEPWVRDKALRHLFQGRKPHLLRPNTFRLGLRTSFRFGPRIAAVANRIAAELDDFDAHGGVRGCADTVGGNAGRADVVHPFGECEADVEAGRASEVMRRLLSVRAGHLHGGVRLSDGGGGSKEGKDHLAVLFRSNKALVRFFLSVSDPCHLKTSWRGDEFRRVAEIYRKNPVRFDAELKAKLDEEDPDQGNLFIFQMVKAKNGDIRSVTEAFSKRSVSAQRAKVILSTVHQSKGLEFHTVVLWDDLAYPPAVRRRMDADREHALDPEHHGRPPPVDLRNVRYVAATRAQHALFLGAGTGIEQDGSDE